MFVQVIQGQTSDPGGLRAQFDRWVEELSEGADGWLGVTGGVTEDGEFIAAVRFASEEEARANSERPEQGRWWEETAEHFAGEVTFHDCSEVELWLDGPNEHADFVQVIQGTVSDRERYRELMSGAEDVMSELRPDIIGGLAAWHGDGGLTEVVYFVDEHAAREGEKQELPEDIAATVDEQMGLVSDLRYLDLRMPWHLSRESRLTR